VTVFDQWNEMLVDGLSTPVGITAADTTLNISMQQWRTNLYTRTYLDKNGDGVSQDDEESGLTLVPINVRYRDGSYANFNSTDLAGFAGFNEAPARISPMLLNSTETSSLWRCTPVFRKRRCNCRPWRIMMAWNSLSKASCSF
jgi:hypothetical protein